MGYRSKLHSQINITHLVVVEAMIIILNSLT